MPRRVTRWSNDMTGRSALGMTWAVRLAPARQLLLVPEERVRTFVGLSRQSR
jgi:hypothetical protein